MLHVFCMFCFALGCLVVFGAPPASAQPMRFELAGNSGNCRGCEWIKAEGEITPDTPRAFREYRQKYGPGGAVILHSPGGSLAAGLELGRLFRESQITTIVGRTVPNDAGSHIVVAGSCASACAYAFLGGVNRTLEPHPMISDGIEPVVSKIGVHRFFRPEVLTRMGAVLFTGRDLDAEQRTTAALAVYMVEMGVDARLLGLATAADATSVRWLSYQEAEQLLVIYKPYEFTAWAIEAHGAGLVAFTRRRDAKSQITISCNRRTGISVIYSSDEVREGRASQLRANALDEEHEIFGVKISTAAIQQGPRLEGRQSLLFRLPTKPSGSSGEIKLSVPRVASFDLSVGTTRMAENVRLALRNCI
jgi:hypothetical protein